MIMANLILAPHLAYAQDERNHSQPAKAAFRFTLTPSAPEDTPRASPRTPVAVEPFDGGRPTPSPTSQTAAREAPAREICRGAKVQADCLNVVSRISRFLDTVPAPHPVASDDVAETVCEHTRTAAPACLGTVAKIRDWMKSTAAVESSMPPRFQAPFDR
jgi:hypothetical protein